MNFDKNINLYRQLHVQNEYYGTTSTRYVKRIVEHINSFKPNNILDFGCGKGYLKNELIKHGIAIDEFDPSIPDKSEIKKNQYDLIITTDVLEHLYENEIKHTMKTFIKLKPKSMFHAICNRSAGTTLPDGSNAHKTIKSIEWWNNRLQMYSENKFDSIVYKNPKDINQSKTSIIVMVKI